MLACLLIALAVLTVRARFNDSDMWWHLKTGEIIATTHTIPTTKSSTAWNHVDASTSTTTTTPGSRTNGSPNC